MEGPIQGKSFQIRAAYSIILSQNRSENIGVSNQSKLTSHAIVSGSSNCVAVISSNTLNSTISSTHHHGEKQTYMTWGVKGMLKALCENFTFLYKLSKDYCTVTDCNESKSGVSGKFQLNLESVESYCAAEKLSCLKGLKLI